MLTLLFGSKSCDRLGIEVLCGTGSEFALGMTQAKTVVSNGQLLQIYSIDLYKVIKVSDEFKL